MHENTGIINMFRGTSPQLVAVLCSTIGAISDGMHYGWSAPFVLQMQESPNSHINVTKFEEEWLETIYLLGGLTGLPVTIFSVDKLGRKWSILMAAMISVVSWILIWIATDIRYLYAARFIVGLSGDVAFVAAPMYIAEIADKKVRGFLSGTIYVMMLFGILIVYSVAPYTEWWVHCAVGVTFVIIQLVIFPFMPDSPYYLLSKGKHDKASRDLKRLRTEENVDKELEEISAAVKRQRSEKGRPQDLVLSKSNRKALIILTVLNGAQHFSGISVILMNLHKILEAAGSTYISYNIAGIMFSAFMLLAATIADFIVDKFGRKFLLIISSLISGLSLFTLAVYFTTKNSGYDINGISWIPIAAVMVYAASFKFGLGIIPIVMTAELFPSKVKAMGMTLADFAYLFFAFLSVIMYQKLIETYSYDFPFYVFAACTLLCVAFSWWYIPETKGKTLEEIQFILKGEPLPDVKPSHGVEKIKNGNVVDEKDINLTQVNLSNFRSNVNNVV